MKSKNTKSFQPKPAGKDFKINNLPFYWISRVSNKYTHRMEVKLKKAGLTVTGWRIGMIIREMGPLSVSEISEHASCRMPTVTKTAYKMQEAELLDIRPHAEDGRVSIVSITPKGLDIINDLIDSTTKIFDSAFVGLSSEQLIELNSMLAIILANLSEE